MKIWCLVDGEQLRAAIESYVPSGDTCDQEDEEERALRLISKPLIYQMVVQESRKIFIQVAAGSATNLKPGLVMQTLFASPESLEENDYAWLVTRCDMYADKGNEQTGRQLVSLEDFAE